jgi:hypothetical protein
MKVCPAFCPIQYLKRTVKGARTNRHTEIGTEIQTDRESTQTDKDRITDGQGTEQRWTGKGPQTDRDRDPDRQGKGHRQTGTGTQTKRKRYRDTDG